jgi:hypothetical protein
MKRSDNFNHHYIILVDINYAMSVIPEDVKTKIETIQSKINEQQDALQAYMALARKPAHATAILPLMFAASVSEISLWIFSKHS